MIALSSFSGYLVSGDSLLAMNFKTAIFLVALAGIFINVPSGRKNWSICSLMGVSIKDSLKVNGYAASWSLQGVNSQTYRSVPMFIGARTL